DQHAGSRQAEAHRRDQALASGEHARVAAMLLQLRHDFIDGTGPEILEGGGNHGLTSCFLRAAAQVWSPSRRRALLAERKRRALYYTVQSSGSATKTRKTHPADASRLDFSRMPGVHAVVLAAGASTRMGTHKLLLPLGGE